MLVGSEIMPGSPAGQRAAAQAALANRGVSVVHNSLVGRALPALKHACSLPGALQAARLGLSTHSYPVVCRSNLLLWKPAQAQV